MVVFEGLQRNIDGPMECVVEVREGVASIWTNGMPYSTVVLEGDRAVIEFDACIQETPAIPVRLRIAKA
jgi:hypothetical protein